MDKQFEPSLGFNLGSDDEGSLVVALFKDIHEGSGLLVGIVSKPQVVEDQNLGLDETANVVEIAASGPGGLEFLEQEVDRQELCGVAFLAQPFSQSNGEMGFTQPGFSQDQQIFQVMGETEFTEFFDLGLGEILVEAKVPVLQIGAEPKARLGNQCLGGSVFAR